MCLGEGIENLPFVVYSRKLIRKMTADAKLEPSFPKCRKKIVVNWQVCFFESDLDFICKPSKYNFSYKLSILCAISPK
jgi:hypothetical protein